MGEEAEGRSTQDVCRDEVFIIRKSLSSSVLMINIIKIFTNFSSLQTFLYILSQGSLIAHGLSSTVC